MEDDGVSLHSSAHPRGSWLGAIKCYFKSFFWPRSSSIEHVELDMSRVSKTGLCIGDKNGRS